MRKQFTSESVTSGHPDKICDAITDAILDAALAVDPKSRIAVEATIKDDFVLIYGEAHTQANLDYAKIAKEVIAEIGYTENYEVLVKVSEQSAEIHQAVDQADEVRAGDQGIMFGYACNETENYMPMTIELAHQLAKKLEDVRKADANSPLMPDGKTQVTLEYENGKPVKMTKLVVSTQHKAEATQEQLKELLMEKVITPIVPAYLIQEDTEILINPSGSFVVGGSFGDSGTTGRKIVVDTYGGRGRIGGGALSSKDPSKVDRSAAYYARYVAKNVVANGLADICEIQLAYAIGCSGPLSVYIDTFGTNKISEEEIMNRIHLNFNFHVDSMIKELDLCRPIYRQTSSYGHFGKPNLPWENVITMKSE